MLTNRAGVRLLQSAGLGAFVCSVVLAEPPAIRLPYGEGHVNETANICGMARMPVPDNVVYETGYAWQYGGVAGESYGALAECIRLDSLVTVCGAVFDLSQTGSHTNELCDVYLWENGEGSTPGSVLATNVGYQMGTSAGWPNVSRHYVPVDACLEGRIWVGIRGAWVGESAPYYIASDLDSGEGCALTNVAPGLGYPSGWVAVSSVWSEVATLGIGLEVNPDKPCDGSPTERSSWGTIKRLYR